MSVYDWLESNVCAALVSSLHGEVGDLEFGRIDKLAKQWRKVHKNEASSRTKLADFLKLSPGLAACEKFIADWAS